MAVLNINTDGRFDEISANVTSVLAIAATYNVANVSMLGIQLDNEGTGKVDGFDFRLKMGNSGIFVFYFDTISTLGGILIDGRGTLDGLESGLSGSAVVDVRGFSEVQLSLKSDSTAVVKLNAAGE